MVQDNMRNRSDFDLPWCEKILMDPDLEWPETQAPQRENQNPNKVINTMFEHTLYTDRGIRAHLFFRRPTKEPESIFPWVRILKDDTKGDICLLFPVDNQEECFLVSIGDGVDGAKGRAHGGFNSLLLDHICGHCASRALVNDRFPATATLTTDYKAEINTPCVILVRGWVIELSGRKVWVRANLEDGDGKILAAGKALFIASKKLKL